MRCHVFAIVAGVEALPHVHRVRAGPIVDAEKKAGHVRSRSPCARSKRRCGKRMDSKRLHDGEAATPIVGIIMGSRSDWETMAPARETLDELRDSVRDARRLGAPHARRDVRVRRVGARAAASQAIIAGAGGAAHLPGMTAAKTLVPVIGVPVQSKALNGLDSLLSIVQMPAGVPVATMAIGGAVNAALFAARIVALHDPGGRRAPRRLRRAHARRGRREHARDE